MEHEEALELLRKKRLAWMNERHKSHNTLVHAQSTIHEKLEEISVIDASLSNLEESMRLLGWTPELEEQIPDA